MRLRKHIDVAQMTFETWLNEEMRRGVLYVCIADDADTYEAAGYKWLKDYRKISLNADHDESAPAVI